MKKVAVKKIAVKKNKDIIAVSAAPAGMGVAPIVRKVLFRAREQGLISLERPVYLSLSFVTAAKMTALNGAYRRVHKPTDVLSFEVPGPHAPAPVPLPLGDLVFCVPVLRKQAKEFGHGLKDEFTVLLVHGLLHLLGYDHEGGARMLARQRKAEDRLLAGLVGLISRSSS